MTHWTLRAALLAGAVLLHLSAASVAQPPAEQPPGDEAANAQKSDGAVAEGTLPATTQSAAEALAALDPERLETDPAYAASILGHIDELDTADLQPGLGDLLASVRLAALITLDRRPEIKSAVQAMLRRRTLVPEDYALLIWAGARIEDRPLLVDIIVHGGRNVRSSGWAQLRSAISPELAGYLLRRGSDDADADRVRLAKALFRIGWAGEAPGDPGWTDSLRTILLEDSLRTGNQAQAAAYVSGITSVRDIVELILQPRFDSLLAPERDRVDLLAEAIEGEDRRTREKLAADPAKLDAVLGRAQYLRSVDREAEALTLLEPHMSDIPALVASDRMGMWMVNEAARAMIALGRGDEAVAMMRRLVELPIADHPGLIGPSINLAGMLIDVGRPEEALREVERLEQIDPEYSNDYGKMLIATAAICSLGQLDRTKEAGPWLERMRGSADEHPEPMLRAHLCLGDLAAAEELAIGELEKGHLDSLLDSFQDYRLGAVSPGTRPFHERLLALRERPRLKAQIERSGRVLSLPLSQSVWGMF